MTRSSAKLLTRSRRVPEVIQTSEMDCGPASLASIAQGFGLPCNYQRLRDACQTDVDGTSIDVLEEVSTSLGLVAEQVMLPIDHTFQRSVDTLPALVVVRQPNGAAHFVVAWKRVGNYLQVMDPGRGRYWTRLDRFRQRLFVHQQEVDKDGWYEWATGEENTQAMHERLALLGCSPSQKKAIFDHCQGGAWQHMARVDAAVRFVSVLLEAKALRRGSEASGYLTSLLSKAAADDAPSDLIPAAHFAVRPGDVEDELLFSGAVMIRFATTPAQAEADEPPPLREEIVESIANTSEPLGRRIRRLFLQESKVRPLFLAVVAAAIALGLTLEALLFRSLIEMTQQLGTVDQRLGALATLVLLSAALLLLEGSFTSSLLGIGRRAELRLRMTVASILPRVVDEFFRSRPASDLGTRAYEQQGAADLANATANVWRSALELGMVSVALYWIAPQLGMIPLFAAVLGIAVPLLFYPALRDIDFKAKAMSGGLSRFYFDALKGVAAVRAHGAERVVRREHEEHLTEWVRAIRNFRDLALACQMVLFVGELGLAAWMISKTQGGQGGDPLLIAFWALYIPAHVLVFIESLLVLPHLRNVTARSLEVLEVETEEEASAPRSEAKAGASIAFRDVSLVLNGNSVLDSVSLEVSPGEKLVVVGASGAGKSSLLGLLLGFHKVTAGELSIDDEPLGPARLASIRSTVAWIDPSANLFPGSVLDGVCYGSNSEQRRHLPASIAVADLQRTLMSLPEGLSSTMGDEGGFLSGGQAQRLRVARGAMRSHASIVLMDEAFRGLERPSREDLTKRTLQHFASATVLAVTHDIEHSLLFDRIVVMEQGRIAQIGSPESLAAQDGLFKNLLEAERSLSSSLWDDPSWRHLKLSARSLRGDATQRRGARGKA